MSIRLECLENCDEKLFFELSTQRHETDEKLVDYYTVLEINLTKCYFTLSHRVAITQGRTSAGKWFTGEKRKLTSIKNAIKYAFELSESTIKRLESLGKKNGLTNHGYYYFFKEFHTTGVTSWNLFETYLEVDRMLDRKLQQEQAAA